MTLNLPDLGKLIAACDGAIAANASAAESPYQPTEEWLLIGDAAIAGARSVGKPCPVPVVRSLAQIAMAAEALLEKLDELLPMFTDYEVTSLVMGKTYNNHFADVEIEALRDLLHPSSESPSA